MTEREAQLLEALWGKSPKRGEGRRNLLLAHLLDTAAVAEQMWEHYLAPTVRDELDVLAGGTGHGQAFFMWLCGIHDCGKAVPAFQSIDADCAQLVWDAGLRWDPFSIRGASWRHDKAGAKLLRTLLPRAGWQPEHVGWVWPLVAGHHGMVPPLGALRGHRGKAQRLQGAGEWEQIQARLVEVFTANLGFTSVAAAEPSCVPSRAVQLQVSGLIIMADWIASDARFFSGIDALSAVGLDRARNRARNAWAELGLRGGWGRLPVPGREAFEDRFGQSSRTSQDMVINSAWEMAAPGLMVVEAPMGEGKTKAALTAAEVLAARFGADGVFVGMPTQATSDPMFSQVRQWMRAIDPELASQVALLHGKRRFNKEWQSLLETAGDSPDDFYGDVDEDDPYGLTAASGEIDQAERHAPAEWFLGRMRGLLCPFVVGTIDQLLFAATRTKHVMLRMAGLAGKVVILDEVHAADVYMAQFLKEGLWWLGQAGVPVVLLSATLPSVQRRALTSAYLTGAAGAEEPVAAPESDERGYPSVTAVWHGEGESQQQVRTTCPWRDSMPVRVRVLDEPDGSAGSHGQTDVRDDAVVELVSQRLRRGGCALVIRNTVERAQLTYQAIRAAFGVENVRLLQGRLHTADRADRTDECLRLLGPTEGERVAPHHRFVVVATQIAEQSFDVDADLLVTDLAPMDLLLQRIGRLHRHAIENRPIERAEVVVTGLARHGFRAPSFPWSLEGIYGRYLLLRTAAVVDECEGADWWIPDQVPELVSRVYDEGREVVPAAWRERESAAFAEWTQRQQTRIDSADPILLTRFGQHDHTTLEGLHAGGSRVSVQDEQVRALVRDGQRSAEVVLVRGDAQGYRTMQGRWLGINGEVATDRVDEVLGTTVRLPGKLTAAAEEELGPLPAWRGHPWLRHTLALVLDQREGAAQLGGHVLRYDAELGLVVTDRRTSS